MQLLKLLAVLLLTGYCLADIADVMKDNEIIPDVLQDVPKELLKIDYDGLLVGDGAEVTPTQTKNIPLVQWSADADSFYTIIMSNADPPSRAEPKWREWLHWLVVNVPGSNVDEGHILAPYISPAPPKAHGLLRYVFLVYKQPGKLEFDEQPLPTDTVAGHENFSSMKFAAKYGMDAVPVAGNVFQAEWDEYVPTVHKQLHLVLN